VLETLMTKDPDACMQWIKSQAPGKSRTDLISSLCTWGRQDQPANSVELAALLPTGFLKEQLLDTATQRWAEEDPLAAYAWAGRQTDEKVRQTVLRRAAGEWLKSDPAGASKWLDSLPAGPLKEAMVADTVDLALNGRKWGNTSTVALVQIMSDDAIRETAGWIARLQNGAERESAYEKFANAWLNKDANAAKEWLSNAPLLSETKERLLAK
jgi:hypothetical protein